MVKRRMAVVLLFTLTLVFVVLSSRSLSSKGASKGNPAESNVASFGVESILTHEPFYGDILKEWTTKGYKPAYGTEVYIPAHEYTAAGNGRFEVRRGLDGRAEPVLLWWDEDSWIEWTVDIPQTGLYQMAIEYLPLDGKSAPIERELLIDGKYPFNEAKRLLFYRAFQDASEPKRDNQGNDIRPGQVEVRRWAWMDFMDAGGLYSEPLRFYLTAGSHTLRLRAIREPMAMAGLRIYGPEEVPTYAEVIRNYSVRGLKAYRGDTIAFEAEAAYLKASPTIRREFNPDPVVHPFAGVNFRLNVFGGWRWRIGGQWVEWRFTIPEDGLYKLGMQVLQNSGNQMPSYRRIEIDGRVPFKELNRYRFPYSIRQQLEVLHGEDGRPYLFYLTKGEHRLRMTPVVGPLEETIRVLEGVIHKTAQLSRGIMMITGPEPDPNFEWELDKQLPDLIPCLEALAEDLDRQVVSIEKVLGRRGSIGNMLVMVSAQLKDMARRPNTIPLRLKDFANSQSSLGAWILELQNSPLQIDRFLVGAPDAEWTAPKASFLRKLKVSLDHFLISFRRNYNGVGNIYDPRSGEKLITIWVARGREWVEIMKELIEEDFTPKTGIRVNVNVMPAGAIVDVLRMSISAGCPPDAAFGCDPALPVDLAIRGGAVNLNQFPDYGEVAKRFRPGALVPYRYRGEDYAIPESQDFTMLFYRIDILGQLGLEVPETWNDVYRMLPVLRRYGLDFYYGSGLDPFLYQNGGDFYTADGLRSALDTPEALKAFTEWTDLYTRYRLPREANFYWHFRVGDIPIGIANYYFYVQIATAAPELSGWWGMAPLPGHREPDGTINRMAGGTTRVAMIFKISKHQKEAWELIKWWTSDTIQERFGRELESLLGVEARWNTANVNALKRLPWPEKDLQSILEQWRWFREQPVVLGGYFTGRHVANAWNRVVLLGMNPRESLEMAVEDINRELERKQGEFGLLPQDLTMGGRRSKDRGLSARMY